MKKLSASSPQGEPQAASGKNTKFARIPFDSELKLSAAARGRLEKLHDLPDEKIDLSDMPQLEEDFWKHAVRNLYKSAARKN